MTNKGFFVILILCSLLFSGLTQTRFLQNNDTPGEVGIFVEGTEDITGGFIVNDFPPPEIDDGTLARIEAQIRNAAGPEIIEEEFSTLENEEFTNEEEISLQDNNEAGLNEEDVWVTEVLVNVENSLL